MDTTFLAVIFISLTEETVKYRRRVKIVQTVQRETVATYRRVCQKAEESQLKTFSRWRVAHFRFFKRQKLI